jgi:uncharacterized membrane protein
MQIAGICTRGKVIMGKILTAYIYISRRLKEPSSMASLSAVMLTFGVQIESGAVHDWLTTGGIFFGLLGVFIKEQPAITTLED